MNSIPAKTDAPVSETLTKPLKLTFHHYQTEKKSPGEIIDEL